MRCEPIPRLCRAAPMLAILALGMLPGLPVRAQDDLPDGFPVGKWILAPSLTASYEADNNVFFKPSENATSDRVSTAEGYLQASLPFRNSLLQFDYTAAKESYAENVFPRDLSQVFGVALELGFKSGDVLTFSDEYRLDFARSEEIDVGGELTFEGEPYKLNRWQVELSRDDPGRQGYLVRIRRQDFNYDGENDIGFFEYRGFDNAFEYRQPLPGGRSWVVRYQTRRYNHYEPQVVSGTVGVPFRNEKADNVTFGLRGLLGDRQPYRVYVGYGRFRYGGIESSSFNGIVGAAAWRLWLGGRTRTDFEAIRRPLPSNFDTFYINNGLRAKLEREWLRFDGGGAVELVINDYADEILVGTSTGVESCHRRDTTRRFEGFLGWRLHEYLQFKVSTFHSVRSSSCESVDYDAAGIETSFTVGWL